MQDDPNSIIVYMYDTGKFRGIFAFHTDELLAVVNEMIEKKQYAKREDNSMGLYYIPPQSLKVLYYFYLSDILDRTMCYTSMDSLADHLKLTCDIRTQHMEVKKEVEEDYV